MGKTHRKPLPKKGSMLRKTHFRGVVWPRGADKQDKEGKPVYRYAIVGVLVTDKPIEALVGVNELLIDGEAHDLVMLLESAQYRKPKMLTGDASNVLLSLDML